MSAGQFEIGIHDWDILFRNLRQFITLNGLAQELRVSSLVTHPYYEQMCDLCAPDLPENKTIEELERIINQRLGRRSDIAERHVFRQRKQGESESVIEYLQSLKQLAKTCNFGYTLEINLRDQFVSGLRHESMRSRLFAEKELDYKRAIELALELESAADAESNPVHAQSRSAASASGEAAAAPAPAGARSTVDDARARCRSKVKRSTIAGEVYPSRPPDDADSEDDEDEDMEVPGGAEGLGAVASTTAHGTHTETATAGAQDAPVHSTSAAAQESQVVAGPKVLVAAVIAQDRAAHATASTLASITDIMNAHARSIAAIFADMVAAMTSVKNEGRISVTVPPQGTNEHSSDTGAPPRKIRKAKRSKVTVTTKGTSKSKRPAHNDDKGNSTPPSDDADSDDDGGRVQEVKLVLKKKKSHKLQPQRKDNRRSSRDSDRKTVPDRLPEKHRSRKQTVGSASDEERRSARSDSESGSDVDRSPAKPRNKQHKRRSTSDKERRSARSDSGSDSDGDRSPAKPRNKRHERRISSDGEGRSARSDSGSGSDQERSPAKPRSRKHKRWNSSDGERRSARSDSGSGSDGDRSPTRPRRKQHKQRISSDGERRSARSESRSDKDGTDQSPASKRSSQHSRESSSGKERRSARSDSGSCSDGAKRRSKQHKRRISADGKRWSVRSDSESGSDSAKRRSKQHKRRISADGKQRSVRSDSESGSDGEETPARRRSRKHTGGRSDGGRGSARSRSGSDGDGDRSPPRDRRKQHKRKISPDRERPSVRSVSGSGSDGDRSPPRDRRKQHKRKISPDRERPSVRSVSGSGSDGDRSPPRDRRKQHKRKISPDRERPSVRSVSGSGSDGDRSPPRDRRKQHKRKILPDRERPSVRSVSGSGSDGGRSDASAVMPGVDKRDVEETPTDNVSVIVEETPTDNVSVIVEETPTDNASVIVEETPTDNASVIVEETPTDNASPGAATASKKRKARPFKDTARERLTPKCKRPICDHERHPFVQPDNVDDIEDPDRMDDSEDTNGQPGNVMPSMPSLSTWRTLFEPRKGGRMGEFDPSSRGQGSNIRQNEQMGEDDAQVDDEEIGVGETFVNYMPSKLKLGLQHPDAVVETASLSSVEPVDVTYELSLPDDLIRNGLLSALQLEAVVYASQAHEHLLPDNTRAGFLIGDGTGTGKGRMIAGIILENYLRGRKRAIWVSVSRVLKNDAERDLRDIGAGNIEVHGLDKIKYGEISTAEEGVIFSTYSALIGETQSMVDTKYRTRLKQLREWCGDGFDGVIVFDECHKAKNLYTALSKISLAVLELQTQLPNARVVYVSATGASGPRNMAYMVRLGIWGDSTPFETFNDFIRAIEKRGVSAMEIIAMDMKLRGMYIARQLSFHGASFNILEVPLSKFFKETYDKSVRLWVVAMQRFAEAAMLINVESSERTTMWAQFWSSHQRFFKYLCVAAKVKRAVSIANEAVKNGKCVVIGLLSTGEASTLDQVERDDGELAEFVSTAKGVFQSLVEKYFPPCYNSNNNREGGSDTSGRLSVAAGRRAESESEEESEADTSIRISPAAERQTGSDGDDAGPSPIQRVRRMKEELLKQIEILGSSLPSNTLDKLVDELGGPDQVAEITGRRGRVVQARGQIQYERRQEAYEPLDILNLVEKQRFMDGQKNVAIISEAASCGISLQSDKRVPNQRQRVHITLEMSFSAEVAVQQFGRTHRSNQVNAPEYIFLISDLKGERRFASILAKRLESLGALTHGDRRAKDTWDLSQFNIDNKYGCAAIKTVIGAIVKKEIPLVAQPSDYPGNFFQDVAKALEGVRLIINNEAAKQLNKDSKTVTVFLNRILGMPVELQNRLFQYFADTLAANIEQARQDGTLDLGIQDLGSCGERVRHEACVRYWRQHATGRAPVELHTVHTERGMNWEQALEKYCNLSGTKEGFYVSKQSYESEKYTAVLCMSAVSSSGNHNMFQTCSPNTGLQLRPKSLAEIEKKYRKVTREEAMKPWCAQFNASLDDCIHTYLEGSCRDAPDCEKGKRSRTFYVLAGLMLPVWERVERVLRSHAHCHKTQVVRVKVDDGRKIIGTLIPKSCVELLNEELSFDAVSTS